MNDFFSRIRVILVHPDDPKNVGAVCRAMKTMHLQSLSIIKKDELDTDKIRHLAIHAFDVFENALFFDTLEDAIRDITLVAGVTRRRGKFRKYFSLFPEEFADMISTTAGTVALVFGNERCGLSADELSVCHLSVAIPSSPLFPSLNLSHAVQVIAYEIYKKLSEETHPVYTPVTDARLRLLTGVVVTSLKNIGFFSQGKQEDLELFFRDIFARARLSGNETKRLEIVFRKICGLLAKKGIDD